MNSTSVPYVGADMAKDKFDVALLIDQSIHRNVFNNTAAGHASFVKWLFRLKALHAHVCLEATGRYSNALALFLHREQIPVSIANPLAVYHFARSQMSRTKTDRHDALLIANYCREKKPRLWQPPSTERQRLADLVRLREQLVSNQVIAARQEADAPGHLSRYFAGQVRLLKRQIQTVEKQINACIEDNPSLQEAAALVETIPGVGRITAATVLAIMPPMDQLAGARQLAAFAGVTPQQNQSGTHRGRTRLSKLGHARLRKALYFPAISALRTNPKVQALAIRLAQKGKAKMSIIGACMRQLLHLIFGVLKNKKPFDPNYQNALASS